MVQMVTSTIDRNPLDPTAMQQQKSSGNESPRKASPAHKLSDLEMIVDRNVAPSPQAMCAELAHEYALEGLHKITDHTDEQNPVRGPVYSENYVNEGTHRKPEE